MKLCLTAERSLVARCVLQVCRTPVIKDCQGEESEEKVCRTVYETECWTKHNVHEVEDEVAICETVEEKKCQEVVEGYTSSQQCSVFPREKCRLEKRKTKKVSPETGCDKQPVELCAPRGCGFVNVRHSSDLVHLRSVWPDMLDRPVL